MSFASEAQMFNTGVNLNTGPTIFFQAGPGTEYRGDGAGPPALKPADRYVDSRARDIVPTEMAIDNGATDVYAVVLPTSECRRNEKPCASLVDILTHAVFGGSQGQDRRTHRTQRRRVEQLFEAVDMPNRSGTPTS